MNFDPKTLNNPVPEIYETPKELIKPIGVSPDGSGFKAQIYVNGKLLYLGTFVNVLSACQAYDNKVIELGLNRKINFTEKEVIEYVETHAQPRIQIQKKKMNFMKSENLGKIKIVG